MTWEPNWPDEPDAPLDHPSGFLSSTQAPSGQNHPLPRKPFFKREPGLPTRDQQQYGHGRQLPYHINQRPKQQKALNAPAPVEKRDPGWEIDTGSRPLPKPLSNYGLEYPQAQSEPGEVTANDLDKLGIFEDPNPQSNPSGQFGGQFGMTPNNPQQSSSASQAIGPSAVSPTPSSNNAVSLFQPLGDDASFDFEHTGAGVTPEFGGFAAPSPFSLPTNPLPPRPEVPMYLPTPNDFKDLRVPPQGVSFPGSRPSSLVPTSQSEGPAPVAKSLLSYPPFRLTDKTIRERLTFEQTEHEELLQMCQEIDVKHQIPEEAIVTALDKFYFNAGWKVVLRGDNTDEMPDADGEDFRAHWEPEREAAQAEIFEYIQTVRQTCQNNLAEMITTAASQWVTNLMSTSIDDKWWESTAEFRRFVEKTIPLIADSIGSSYVNRSSDIISECEDDCKKADLNQHDHIIEKYREDLQGLASRGLPFEADRYIMDTVQSLMIKILATSHSREKGSILDDSDVSEFRHRFEPVYTELVKALGLTSEIERSSFPSFEYLQQQMTQYDCDQKLLTEKAEGEDEEMLLSEDEVEGAQLSIKG